MSSPKFREFFLKIPARMAGAGNQGGAEVG
jgi:hypothetical protein